MSNPSRLPDGYPEAENRSAWAVFFIFLKLGLTAFGGPIAHLGYFRREFVDKRRWLSDEQYSQLLAICQFLPGPASSQVGFSLGLLRAGWPGAVAAFIAFTAPSVLLLLVFASTLPLLSGTTASAAIHGLKLVALAVITQALSGMLGKLCPDPTRKTLAAGAAVIALTADNAAVQLLVIALGAGAGIALWRGEEASPAQPLPVPYSPRTGWILLSAFALLLALLPLVANHGNGELMLLESFYRAGALVFGGGHVVLPLLEATTVERGWLSAGDFLAGYGAAQAVPGPLFSFAAFLGGLSSVGPGGVGGAALALIGIFLPGFLLVAGALPLWQQLAQGRTAARAVAGINAAVVGLLAAALYDPVFIDAIASPADLAIGIVAVTLLMTWRLSPLYVILWCVAARTALSVFP